MYLRSVIFPAERDRVRQNKMVHVERPACEIIGAFQAADISAAIGDSCLIEDCQCKAAVVKVCAVQRDKCLGSSGKIAFCTVVIVRQDSLVVVDYGKPFSVKGHRADSRVYRRIQIIGRIIGTQHELIQSVRILRQDADAPLGLLDADELLRFGYVYIIIFRLKIRYRQLLQSVTCFAVD